MSSPLEQVAEEVAHGHSHGVDERSVAALHPRAPAPAATAAPKQNRFIPPSFKGPRPVVGADGDARGPAAGGAPGARPAAPPTEYYAVLYRKQQNKKHNPYTEGVLTLTGQTATVLSEEGKYVSRETSRLLSLEQGAVLHVGSFEVEVTQRVDADVFLSGRIFMAGAVGEVATASAAPLTTASSGQRTALARPLPPPPAAPRPPPVRVGFRPPRSTAADGASVGGSTELVAAAPAAPRARHDPTAPDAVVLQTPGEGGGAVHVVVDPYLSQHLRPHQRQGVEFLWRCITGLRGLSGEAGPTYGAILADDMGLGKTLTAIALIWTALKNSGAGPDKPLAHKVVVVTPSSLVGNWRGEFSRWLGTERCRVVAVSGVGKEAEDTVRGFAVASTAVQPVLIISYEMARKYADALAGMGTGGSFQPAKVGLLVCDEAHRLKSAGGSKTMEALLSIPTARRVLLTGTPMQNNLQEFFAMSSFACPGLLGSLSKFKRTFEGPIQAGRDASASHAEVELGRARAEELARVTAGFVIRRTAEVLNKYLPPKTESVVLCRMSPLQGELYTAVARAYARSGLGGRAVDPTSALLALTVMGKACAHPDLLHSSASGAGGAPAGPRPPPSSVSISKRRAVGHPVALAHGGSGGGAGGRASPTASRGGEWEEEGGEEEEEGGEDILLDSDSDDGADGGGDSTGVSEDEPHASLRVVGQKVGRTRGLLAILDSDEEEEAHHGGGREAVSSSRRVPSAPPISSSSSSAPRLHPPLDLDFTSQKTVLAGLARLFPPSYTPGLVRSGVPAPALLPSHTAQSGKLCVLDALLSSIRRECPWDRVVLVSSHGTALDLMEGLCEARGWATLRLDGSTPSAERTGLVARFNAQPAPSTTAGTGVGESRGGPLPGTPFAFLLSSRAGGVGLNLIGANRLVLFDPNWNPAVDKQALARVWRDGQRKHVYIYRLLTAHSVEEKVLQRQLLKEDLGGAVEGQAGGGGGGGGGTGSLRLSSSELKALFHVDPLLALHDGGYGCDTLGVLHRANAGRLPVAGGESLSLPWPPYAGPSSVAPVDAVLADALGALGGAGASPSPSPVTFVRTLLFNVAQGAAGVVVGEGGAHSASRQPLHALPRQQPAPHAKQQPAAQDEVEDDELLV